MLLKLERFIIELKDAGLDKVVHRSAEDRERMDRAYAINRQIGKQLSALKKAKKAS